MVPKLSSKEIELIKGEYHLVSRRHLDTATLARLSRARVCHYLERAKLRKRRRLMVGGVVAIIGIGLTASVITEMV